MQLLWYCLCKKIHNFTVFENHSKSLILKRCKRSELRLFLNSASPKINIDLISKDNHGRTALIVAYGYGQYDVVKLKIDNHCVFCQK